MKPNEPINWWNSRRREERLFI